MDRTVLPPMSAGELDAALRVIDAVVDPCGQWCARFSVLDDRHVLPVTLLTIVNHPEWDPGRILSRVKNTLWVFALDDAMDDGTLDDEALQSAVVECRLAMSGLGGDSVRTDLARALVSVRQELETYPLFDRLGGLWVCSLSRVLEGMMYEHAMQRRFSPLRFTDPLPPSEEYMYFARGSIAVPHLWLASLIIASDPACLPGLPRLLDLFEACAQAIRIANDLRTFEREVQEGGINAVALRVHQLMSENAGDLEPLIAQAKEDVRQRLRMAQDTVYRLARSLDVAPDVSSGFVRATEFAVSLYDSLDFRNWTAAASHEQP